MAILKEMRNIYIGVDIVIYDSASNRPDYAPVLVGNGDMAFAVNAEGTLGYEKADFPGIKNFWSPYIFRAGHRTGINLHKSINANLLTFGAFSFDAGSELVHFTQELLLPEGYQQSLCNYADDSKLASRFFMHQDKNLYALEKYYEGQPKTVTYRFSYGRDHRFSALKNAQISPLENGVRLDYCFEGQDSYRGKLTIWLDQPCKIRTDPEGVTFTIALRDGMRFAFYISADDAPSANFETLLQENIALWQDYFSQGYVRTGNTKIDNSHLVALYHLKSITTKWSIPVGILDSYWDGKFFAFDEHYGYLGLLASNQTALAKRVPLFRRDICLPNAIQRVTKFCEPQARFPWITTEYGFESARPGHWLDHVFHIPLIAIGAYEYFTYAGDLDFLRQSMPMLRACAQFFTQNMIYRDGSRVYIGKCTDLERLGSSIEQAFMTTCGAIRLLEVYAEAAAYLSEDEVYATQCKETAAALRQSLPQDEEKYLPFPDCDMRSIGLFAGKFPFDVLPDEDLKMQRALADYCANEAGVGNMYRTGSGISPWYACWKAEGFARAGMAEEAEQALEQVFASTGCFGEMFEINEAVYRGRPWFMTAAGIYLSAVSDMLIRSDTQRIELLPACSWENVSFKLAAKGGVTVEAVIENGQPVKVVLYRKASSIFAFPEVAYRGKPIEHIEYAQF